MRIVVVGSGASGVHFAITALERGHEVTLLDVGNQRGEVPAPAATFDELKDLLPDPAGYFLGPDGAGVVYPASRPSYYGHPPSKHYVFDVPPQFHARAEAMEPLFSFARGGFAEAWTAGSYSFAPEDLADFPFDYEALRPHYDTVARRIGVGAADDDLAQFFPRDAAYLPPLTPDPHSAWLLQRYGERRRALNASLGFYLGRSRVATLSAPLATRSACTHCGRCLWGCPIDAIYRPAVTLADCARFHGFRYLPRALVSHFEYDEGGLAGDVVIEPLAEGVPTRIRGDLVVLAAGTLATTKIVLDSIWRRTGRVERLTGLMDNRQIHVPFLSVPMIGQPALTASYQFHHLAFGLTTGDPRTYVHGQITTLKAASVHPVVASLPLDLATSLRVFRSLRAALGIANVNLHDTRRRESWATISPTGADHTALVLHYEDPPDEPGRLADAVARTGRALRKLGCVVPPGMSRILPKGASVHYSGTLPMTAASDAPLTCDSGGRLRAIPNVLIADGAGFPALPAKNLTFTLMANATRIATRLT